jgi:hypothetical protein
MPEKKKITKKQPAWDYSFGRRKSMAKAQRVHKILVAIGKEYRNQAIRKAKYKGLLK